MADEEDLGIVDDAKEEAEGSEKKESRWRDKVEGESGLDEASPETAAESPSDDVTSPSPEPDAPPPRRKKKVDPNKPQIKLKVTIVSAGNLRPGNYYNEVSTSCACELIDAGTKKPKDDARFETEVVQDTKHPSWKKEHTWDHNDFDPGDCLKFSVKDVNGSEDILGCAELDSKKFFPDGFEGPCQLKTANGEKNESVAPMAHVLVKVEVESPEDIIAERAEKKKLIPFQPQKAKAQAIIDKGDLSPWAERVAGATESTPRVAPGNVLKPKGTPRYEKLYHESILRQGRMQQRKDLLEKSQDQAIEDNLLAWHKVEKKKEGEFRKLTKEETEEIVTRLYSDADSRRAKLEQKIVARDERIAALLVPLAAPAEHEDPNQVITESVTKLNGDYKVKQDKLAAKRKEFLEKELESLIKNSIHAKLMEEGKEPDIEFFKNLHEDYNKKSQKIAARVWDAGQQAVQDAGRKHQLILPSESLLKNGVRLAILGAKGLSRPEHGSRPEPYVVCQLKPGTQVRSRPVRWQNQVSWKEEFDLTELYDGKSPLRFFVYVEEPGKQDKIDRLLGTASLEGSQFLDSGFEDELVLKVPTRLDEDPVFVNLKRMLRGAGYKYGGVNLKKLHRFCDRDGNGKISFNEFVTSVRKDAKLTFEAISDKTLQRIFDEIDVDGDGEVDFQEFQSWMNSSREKPVVDSSPPSPSPFSPEPDEAPPAPETPAPGEEKEKAPGEEKEKDKQENEDTNESRKNLHKETKGEELQDDDKIKGAGVEVSPTSPGSPQEPIPEPSPLEKTKFGEYPASPSMLKFESVASPAVVAGQLLIKIEILPPLKQGKRAFLAKSVDRLYKKHFEVKDKIDLQKDTWARRVDDQAQPTLLPSSIPTTPQGELLEYYHRLYLDAHRRTMDKRIKLKTELRELKLMQDEVSIHQKLQKERVWEEKDIQAVFDRVYQPPKRRMQLFKPVPEESRSVSADSDDAEDTIVEYIPLPPRRMGIFFNRAGLVEEGNTDQKEDVSIEPQTRRESMQGGRGRAPRQSLQGKQPTTRQSFAGTSDAVKRKSVWTRYLPDSLTHPSEESQGRTSRDNLDSRVSSPPRGSVKRESQQVMGKSLSDIPRRSTPSGPPQPASPVSKRMTYAGPSSGPQAARKSVQAF